MRRLAAHLALATIWVGSLTPVTVAAQMSSLHACCLRAGSHHCQETSSDVEFRSSGNACPYSAPLLKAIFAGLGAAVFQFAAPDRNCSPVQKISSPRIETPICSLSARSPPVPLLA